MKTSSRVIWALVVLLAIGGVLLLKAREPASAQPDALPAPAVTAQQRALPTMLEFGSTTCIPCRAMAPIIAELERDYAEHLVVRFIDVQKSPDEMAEYEVTVIPTQVFVSADGKELFRHEGFFAKEEILERWNQLGYELK